MADTLIRIDRLSPDSIRRARRQLEEYRRRLTRKTQEIAGALGAYCAEVAQELYGSAAAVTVTPTAGGCLVTAQGHDLFFVEFGTGVYAGSGHPWTERAPVEVYPGSWSESPMGEHTWSRWIAAGNPPEEYPYNSQASMPLYRAFMLMREEAARIANEVMARP